MLQAKLDNSLFLLSHKHGNMLDIVSVLIENLIKIDKTFLGQKKTEFF